MDYRNPPKEIQPSRLAKLIARALDPAALSGEAENSGTMAIREARRNGLDVSGFAKAIGGAIQIHHRAARNVEPPACEVVVRFGKYNGVTLGRIARNDPNYLIWIVENVTRRPEIVTAAEVVAEYFGLGVHS